MYEKVDFSCPPKYESTKQCTKLTNLYAPVVRGDLLGEEEIIR